MSVKQVQVNVVTSVDNFLALVQTVAADVKGGKSPSAVVADATPALVTALESMGDLAADVADRKDLETTVALRLAGLVNVFVG